jgi:hypothetical protein
MPSKNKIIMQAIFFKIGNFICKDTLPIPLTKKLCRSTEMMMLAVAAHAQQGLRSKGHTELSMFEPIL